MGYTVRVDKYAVEGENAKKMYDVIVNSYIYKAYPDSIELDCREGVLIITEVRTCDDKYRPRLREFVLPFVIGKAYYYCYYFCDSDSGEISQFYTDDTEGKYFAKPSAPAIEMI
jgi:hypothetical protein